MAAIKLTNITAYAVTLVILSGDVALNPGPVKDPCAICQKGCRQNQKAIQCDLCDKWFHAKCIGMNNTKYRELSNPSMSWQCIKCLFPACDSPVCNPSKKTCRKNGVNQGIELNPNLKKRGMKFAHVNIATLIGHYTDMEVLLDEAKVDVFAVTESRLDSTILDSQICLSGYVCFRKDRNRNGGSCAVFVKNKWPSKRRIDLEVDSLEMVCVEICPDKAKNTIFTVMYKPPIMKHDEFVEGFEKNLTKLADEMNKDITTMGDFNANVIAPKLCKYSRKLMQISSLHCLNQLIKEPTRVTEHTSTAIDLIFVNNAHRFVSHDVQNFGASDHSIIFAIKKAGICKARAEIRESRSFKRYNREHFCKDIAGIRWSVIETFDEINDAVSTWNNLFVDVANRHAPLKRIRTKGGLKPWITKDIKELMAERDYALKVAKRSGQNWDNYRNLKNFTNRKIKAAEAKYYKDLIESSLGPREMWSQKYEPENQSELNPLDLQPVNHETVRTILNSLKVNKAAGLDKISARMIKDAGYELAPSIAYLVNKSITDGIVLDLWKIARVTPVYKADDKLLVENYRPISVLPVLSKILEKVVYTQLCDHLDQLNYIYPHQYGFRRGHNTAQAIAQVNNWVLESMDKGKITGLLFVDISKAFDSINHKVLLGKLGSAALSRRALKLFHSYLIDRKQSVLVNGEMSDSRSVVHDVPQGSILGPLLFNIYVNSLPNAVENTRVILYADDAVLISAASTSQELQKTLEHTFNLISEWYSDNRLTLNVKKTKFILAGSKTKLLKFEDFKLQSQDGGEIDRVKSFKYLGVKLDEKWSWKPHIKDLLQKLGHRLSVFNRITHMLDYKSRAAYFKGLVLPHLDYADMVWGDQAGVKTEMQQLQAFQNQFA